MSSSTTSAVDRSLRIFVDTADIESAKALLSLGFIYGVTTNPTILRECGQACDTEHLTRLARELIDSGAQEVHLQTWGASAAERLQNGRRLAAIDPSIVVKVTATGPGFAIARALRDEGVRITLTAVYTIGQVVAAAGMGLAYAAPYFGRMGEPQQAEREISAMMNVLKEQNAGTRLLLASVRSRDVAGRLFALGVNTMTARPNIISAFVSDERTATDDLEFERQAATS